jgi:FkbM family methyltransferase
MRGSVVKFPLLEHLGVGDVDIDFEHARKLDMYQYVKRGTWSYEPDVLATLLCLLTGRPHSRFINVGANMGYFSILVKKLFGEQVEVFAYEPMPDLALRLRKAEQRNEIDLNLSDAALSDFQGTAPFHLSAKSDTSNSLNPDFRPAKEVVEVAVTTLDAEFPKPDRGRFSLPGRGPRETPTVLLIDTESTEPSVLRGGLEFIERVQPAIICEVLAGRTEVDLSRIVEQIGYRSYALTDHGPELRTEVVGDVTYQHRDWLFLPRNAPEVERAQFEATFEILTPDGP